MIPRPEGPADTERQGIDVLVFRASGTTFGVCIDQILEIEEVDEFARLTSDDPTLRGALVARGRPIPMVDLCRKLGLAAAPRYTAPAMLVTAVAGSEVGFLVDDPEDVTTLPPAAFRALPELIQRTRTLQAIFAMALWRDRILVLVDITALMTAEEAARCNALAREAFPAEALP